MNDKIFYTEDGFAVKTVFVKYFTRDMKGDQIVDYFSTFGMLRSVRMQIHAASLFGFVKFEAVEAAARVLNMEHHAIDGHEIEVEIANICHQDEPSTNDKLPIESTNATGKKFMDLNDDCLREILTRVTRMDLCSLRELSETGKNIRLKAITNEIFSRKHKSFHIYRDVITVDKVERLLANFGSLIPELSAYNFNEEGTESRRILKSIIQHCSGTLKVLSLSNFDAIGEEETSAMKRLFGNLKCLDIAYCGFEGAAADLFATCKSLDTLSVSDNHNTISTEAIFQQTFSDLQSFSYSGLFNLEVFISRHKKLKSISLMGSQQFSDLLPVLAQNCSELKELLISSDGDKNPGQYETSVKSISALKNLEKLRIYGDKNAIKFVQELSSLQSLRKLILMYVRYVPGLETALSKLKMLEELSVFCCENFTNFQPLAELGRLKNLTIWSNDVFTFDLVYMVSRLADLEKLFFYTFNNNLITIDKQTHFRIVDALSQSGRAKRTLEIGLNGVRTHFRSHSRF